MNEARAGWFQRHLEADRNRFRVTGGGVASRLFEVELEGPSYIVYTLLHTAKHTTVTHTVTQWPNSQHYRKPESGRYICRTWM